MIRRPYEPPKPVAGPVLERSAATQSTNFPAFLKLRFLALSLSRAYRSADL